MAHSTSPPTASSPTSSTPSAPRPPSLTRWTARCALAEAVGIGTAAAAYAVVDARGAPGTGPEVAAALALVVGAGLVEGAALGGAQAGGLRAWLPDTWTARRARRWVLVTVLVAGLGWAAGSAPAVLSADAPAGDAGPSPWLVVLGAAGLGAAMGAVLGAVQAGVLRGVVAHPRRWVTANVLAWMAAMVVLFLGATGPAADWPVWGVVTTGVLSGALAGALVGVVTGWMLPSLSGAPPANRVVLAVLGSGAHRLLDRDVVGLRLHGRISGRTFTFPVQYARVDDGVVVVPGRPERKRWWRNLRDQAPVQVLDAGTWRPGVGRVLEPGQPGYADAAAAYAARWSRARLPDGQPVVLVRL